MSEVLQDGRREHEVLVGGSPQVLHWAFWGQAGARLGMDRSSNQ